MLQNDHFNCRLLQLCSNVISNLYYVNNYWLIRCKVFNESLTSFFNDINLKPLFIPSYVLKIELIPSAFETEIE